MTRRSGKKSHVAMWGKSIPERGTGGVKVQEHNTVGLPNNLIIRQCGWRSIKVGKNNWRQGPRVEGSQSIHWLATLGLSF